MSWFQHEIRGIYLGQFFEKFNVLIVNCHQCASSISNADTFKSNKVHFDFALLCILLCLLSAELCMLLCAMRTWTVIIFSPLLLCVIRYCSRKVFAAHMTKLTWVTIDKISSPPVEVHFSRPYCIHLMRLVLVLFLFYCCCWRSVHSQGNQTPSCSHAMLAFVSSVSVSFSTYLDYTWFSKFWLVLNFLLQALHVWLFVILVYS